MIFVTVGTHEQQFDRLIKKIDDLKREGKIEDEVFIQLGYSTYIPEKCNWKKMIGYDEMNEYMNKARIIITHGGPGSIFQSINLKKMPVVVARNPKYNEHIDNHQIEFTRKLHKKGSILAVEDIDEIEYIIKNYEDFALEIQMENNLNSDDFIMRFSLLIENMMCGGKGE